jgi:protein-tyrosine phosphatase
MTDEAVQLAVDLGVPAEVASTHRSRFLLDAMLAQPDLILTMTRDHRREVAELAPSRLRSTFTIREFARIASSMSDDKLRAASAEGGTDAAARVRAMGMGVAAQRGLTMPLATPDDDDVIDPYGRSWQTYQLSASQLAPAIDQVVRAVSLAVAPAS